MNQKVEIKDIKKSEDRGIYEVQVQKGSNNYTFRTGETYEGEGDHYFRGTISDFNFKDYNFVRFEDVTLGDNSEKEHSIPLEIFVEQYENTLEKQ